VGFAGAPRRNVLVANAPRRDSGSPVRPPRRSQPARVRCDARADLPPAQDFAGKEIPRDHTEAIRQALLELATIDPLRRAPDLFYVSLFDIALGTGLRLGELRALRWGDVDRERLLIRVERAYSREVLKRPKTDAGVRAVPLFPSVDVGLRELAARAVERGRYAPAELIFGSMLGTPLQPSNFRQRVWGPALDRAGLGEAGYRFHDLRHTCVSRLVAAGADIKLVQAVAGHSNPLITLKRYSHLLGDRITEAATRFDPARISLADGWRWLVLVASWRHVCLVCRTSSMERTRIESVKSAIGTNAPNSTRCCRLVVWS